MKTQVFALSQLALVKKSQLALVEKSQVISVEMKGGEKDAQVVFCLPSSRSGPPVGLDGLPTSP
jgi:hypothetical protein